MAVDVTDPTNVYEQPKSASGLSPAKAIAQIMQPAQAALREEFLRLPADYLIINDLVFDNIPPSAISIEIETDIEVIETLRTTTAAIEPKGRGMATASIQLMFPEGPAQMVTLRRLMAELLHHPFVFVENNKIRQALYPPLSSELSAGGGSAETMVFVLHFGSLSISDQMPGVLMLDLQLAEFNYKPFSHHFWYGTTVHGRKIKELQDVQEGNTPVTKEKRFPYGTGFEASDFIAPVRPNMQNELLTATQNTITSLGGTVNAPVVFPAQSGAFLYFADHLEKTVHAATVADKNTDYLGLVYKEYAIKVPEESDNALSDTGTLSDFFGPMKWGDAEKQSDPYYISEEMRASKEAIWWGADRGKAPAETLKQPKYSSSGKTSSQRYSASYRAEGGGSLYLANFYGPDGTAYSMTPTDRFELAKLLVGEHHSWKKQISDLRLSLMAWTMMNRFRGKPGRFSSFASMVKAFSQPIMAKNFWAHKKLAASNPGDPDLSQLEGNKKSQFMNQYKTVVAVWPGTNRPLKINGEDCVIPQYIVDFVNNFAAGKIPKPVSVGGKIGEISEYKWFGSQKNWDTEDRGKAEADWWKKDNSGTDPWPYTNFANKKFALSSETKGHYATPQIMFLLGELWLRDKGYSLDAVRTVKAEEKSSGAFADTLIWRTDDVMRAIGISEESTMTSSEMTEETEATIAVIGDSLVAGLAPLAKGDPSILICGHVGKQTSYVLSILNQVLTATVKKVVVLVGVNDIASGRPSSVTIDNLRQIYAKIKEAGKTPVPVTILPWAANKQYNKKKTNEINTWIKVNSTYAYVDTSFMGDANGNLLAAYSRKNGDGLHPNAAGSRALLEAILAKV